jgi:23S rRNA (cytosine1962-C5)-methyltransferase
VADIQFVQGDVFAELRRLRAEGQTFGLIVLDPPKFARSPADLEKALRGYKDINLVGMQCLGSGGILVSCSCSQHVDEPTFEAMLNDAASDIGREVQILERRGQAADHPVVASCTELRYLKCYICRVL